MRIVPLPVSLVVVADRELIAITQFARLAIIMIAVTAARWPLATILAWLSSPGREKMPTSFSFGSDAGDHWQRPHNGEGAQPMDAVFAIRGHAVDLVKHRPDCPGCHAEIPAHLREATNRADRLRDRSRSARACASGTVSVGHWWG